MVDTKEREERKLIKFNFIPDFGGIPLLNPEVRRPALAPMPAGLCGKNVN